MIYFIQEEDDGPIKIGVADSPVARIGALQTGNPRELNLLSVMDGGYREEADLHVRFAAGSIRGEWFDPGTPGLQELLDQIGRLPRAVDPPEGFLFPLPEWRKAFHDFDPHVESTESPNLQGFLVKGGDGGN